jgi:hypothetical protein
LKNSEENRILTAWFCLWKEIMSGTIVNLAIEKKKTHRPGTPK